MRETPCQRIGHGGASALAPANTIESFEAAREVGIDILEFDVRARGQELVLGHTALDARNPRALGLKQALVHLSRPSFSEIELNVDLKRLGCERAVLGALRDAGALERTLISCQVPTVLDVVRRIEPRARVAVSVGGRLARLTRRWRDWRFQVIAGLAQDRWQAVCAHHRLIDRQLLERIEAHEGFLYAWTVNDRPRLEALRKLGVHGITTADPRLFHSDFRPFEPLAA